MYDLTQIEVIMLTSFIDIIPVKLNRLSICFINFVADLSQYITKKRHNLLLCNLLCRY